MKSRIDIGTWRHSVVSAFFLVLTVLLLRFAVPTTAAASPGEIAYFQLPDHSYPQGITAGPDGHLWFMNGGAGRVGRISTSGEVQEFSLPPPANLESQIAAGPDGNVWFTQTEANKIGRVTPAGQITEFPVPQYGAPYGITTGPDGAIWATLRWGAIARVTPQGEFSVFPGAGGLVEPIGITAGPDGNLWIAETTAPEEGPAERFGRITRVSLAGQMEGFRIPPLLSDASSATGITNGPDGNLWYVGGSSAGRIATTGAMTQLDVPTFGEIHSITAGPDGNVWFAASGGPFSEKGAIGRITPRGFTTLFELPTEARGVTAGPDGNVWFTEPARSRVGRITPGAAGIDITTAWAHFRGRRLRLPVACTGGRPGLRCRGVVKLISPRKLRPSGERVGTRLIAKAPYRLVSESTLTIKLRLTQKARSILRPGVLLIAVAEARAGVGISRRLIVRGKAK
jgi:streptogramin lyase